MRAIVRRNFFERLGWLLRHIRTYDTEEPFVVRSIGKHQRERMADKVVWFYCFLPLRNGGTRWFDATIAAATGVRTAAHTYERTYSYYAELSMGSETTAVWWYKMAYFFALGTRRRRDATKI